MNQKNKVNFLNCPIGFLSFYNDIYATIVNNESFKKIVFMIRTLTNYLKVFKNVYKNNNKAN